MGKLLLHTTYLQQYDGASGPVSISVSGLPSGVTVPLNLQFYRPVDRVEP